MFVTILRIQAGRPPIKVQSQLPTNFKPVPAQQPIPQPVQQPVQQIPDSQVPVKPDPYKQSVSQPVILSANQVQEMSKTHGFDPNISDSTVYDTESEHVNDDESDSDSEPPTPKNNIFSTDVDDLPVL